MASWENRIIGYDIKPASWFQANPNNWRIHPQNQQEGLEGNLESLGWIQNVIVNQRTGNMIDGHLRVTLALRKGDDEPVPVTVVDLSEEEEAQALLTIDPIGAMAVSDRSKIEEILTQFNSDNEQVQKLISHIAESNGIFGELPALDDLEDEYGESSEEDFYVTISFKVPQHVKDKFAEVMKCMEGGTEAEKFESLLNLVHGE